MYKNIVGTRHGHIEVIEDLGLKKDGRGKNRHYFNCKCDCGNYKIFTLDSIQKAIKNKSESYSCGCKRYKDGKHPTKKGNDYYIVGDITYVKYSNKEDCFIIDTKSLDKIKEYTWRYQDVGKPPLTNIGNKYIKLSRYLLDYDGKLFVDHINRKPWDNRECNLRIVTNQCNNMNASKPKNNTSGFKGVTYSREHGKWRAQMHLNRKRIDLGIYISKRDAIYARLKADLEIFKEYSIYYHMSDEEIQNVINEAL